MVGKFGKCCCPDDDDPDPFPCEFPGYTNTGFGPLSGTVGNTFFLTQELAPKLVLPSGFELKTTVLAANVRIGVNNHTINLAGGAKRDLWNGIPTAPTYSSPYGGGVAKAVVGPTGFWNRVDVVFNIPGAFSNFSINGATHPSALVGEYKVRMQVVGSSIAESAYTITYNTQWYGVIPGYSVGPGTLYPVKFPKPNYVPGNVATPGSEPPIFSLCWAAGFFSGNQSGSYSGFEWKVF